MMGMLLPLGIEKGKDFKPDVATVARLNSAAAEAHAWLLAQIPTFVADWWPGQRQAAGEFADRRVLPFHAVPTFGLALDVSPSHSSAASASPCGPADFSTQWKSEHHSTSKIAINRPIGPTVAGADGNDAIDPIAAEAVMTVSRRHARGLDAHHLNGQPFGGLKIRGIGAFGEPTVYVGEQSACFVVSAERSHI